MARIAEAADVHARRVVESRGYRHIRRPISGVKITIQLTDEEARRVERQLDAGRRITQVFATGWAYHRLSKTLQMTYRLTGNNWTQQDSANVANDAINFVRRSLSAIPK